MEKLTWAYYGLILLAAGFAGLACSQETQEPLEIGTVQVELRSDLVLSESQHPASVLLVEKNPNNSGQPQNQIQATRRISLTAPEKYLEDRIYNSVNRYEFLPDIEKDPKSQKSSTQNNNVQIGAWALTDKHWVRAGKGFGVAAENMVSSKMVGFDHASYYFPTVVSKPYSKPSEHLEPMVVPFKSQKPLIFHRGATGFAHKSLDDTLLSDYSSASETRLKLSPISETRVYLSSKPKTHVTLIPAKTRLDLINGNTNLNRDRFKKLSR